MNIFNKRATAIKLITFIFLLRFILICVRAFGEIVQPHTWRQIDTLGMSYRYYLKFTVEAAEGSWFHKLLPAVLQNGDSNGIMPAELPLLNLIFAPLWALGPYWGKVCVYLLFAVLIFGSLFLLRHKLKNWLAPSLLLLPVFSWSADYIEKFMPDTFAMVLVLAGCLILIKSLNHFKRSGLGIFLITLGVLVKPPAIVGLGLLLLHRGFTRRFWRFVPLLIVPLIFAVFYYTLGLQWIDQFRSGNATLFAVAPRDPIQAIHETVLNPIFVLTQWRDRLIMPFGGLLILFAFALARKTSRRMIIKFVLVLFAQFFTVCVLDGGHVAQHDYYFLSLAPTACGLFWFAYRAVKRGPQTNPRLFINAIFLLVIFGHGVELAVQNLSRAKLTEFYHSRAECQSLMTQTPALPWRQGAVFRSSPTPFPALGLCFGEREGSSQSKFGYYFNSDPLPSGCTTLAAGPRYYLAECK